MCMFCRSLFVTLSSFFWPLYCIFFDLWLLIISLVYSKFSSCTTKNKTLFWNLIFSFLPGVRNLVEHLSSPLGFSGVRVTRALALYVMFCRSLFILCYFFFWPLCSLFFCLLAIVLSVLLSFGHCVVCSSVFWPLCSLFFCLLAIVLPVLLHLRILITPFGIFKLFLYIANKLIVYLLFHNR